MAIPEKTNWNNKAFSGFKSGFKALPGFGRGKGRKGDKGKAKSQGVVQFRRRRSGLRGAISKIHMPGMPWKRSKVPGRSRPSNLKRSDNQRSQPKIKVNPKYKRRYWFIFAAFQAIIKQTKYILMIAGGTILILLIYALTQTNLFKVKEITFEGVDKTDKTRLEQIAAKYKGKNIYLVNLTKVEQDTAKTSVYIKSVYAKKKLPSRIVINITERYPNLVLVTLDGVYLVDKDNVVISRPVNKQIEFTADEWQAYYTQDVNLDIVQKRVQADLKNKSDKFDPQYLDNKGNFDYTKVPDKNKTDALKEIKTEMDQITAQHFKELNQQINSADYAGLPRIYIYQNTDYKEGKRIDSQLLDYTVKVLDYFNLGQKYHITETIWQTAFTLRIQTTENKQFYFGLNRDIDTQINDLDVVMKYLESKNQKFKVIDVRTEKTVVKN